ncbi:MAG: HTH domain-containing protein [bacterium]|nr:winged helix-turn-helix domain-containing protein [bacterium]MBU1428809.1 winged helix-turn-helix domain-containing protein [bacterium]MBU2439331.1 winged helix-turn-helix domain-containing protein [bacterium]
MKHKSVADSAYEILIKHKKPLHYRQITKELTKIRPLKVKEPYYAVNASMSGDKRFMRIKRGVWGLVKWQYKDANIKYSLTSYCLKDGTMFLTSYMRPFFPKEENAVEITFIDKEGNEIEAIVNNVSNYIVGLKEWYKKKKLKINDVVFVGLIDYDRKRYFLVTEDETKMEPQDDLSEKIFKILQEACHPLTYKEICERVLEVEVNEENLFSKYIDNILRKDFRFIEEKEEMWGLFDWLSEIKKLQLRLISSEDNESLKKLLQKVFEFLGFETSIVLEGQVSFILARALLDYKTYNLIVDAKLSDKKNEKIQKYEHWNELSKVKEETKSDYSVIISPDFDYDKLSRKTDKNKVILFELRWLCNLIEEHDKLPFALSNLESIFLADNSIENNIFQLFEKRKILYNKIKLINIIINLLHENSGKKLYLNVESLTKIINQRTDAYIGFTRVQEYEVEEITKIFSLEPFNIIQKTEMGSIILNFKPELAKERLNKAIGEIF